MAGDQKALQLKFGSDLYSLSIEHNWNELKNFGFTDEVAATVLAALIQAQGMAALDNRLRYEMSEISRYTGNLTNSMEELVRILNRFNVSLSSLVEEFEDSHDR